MDNARQPVGLVVESEGSGQNFRVYLPGLLTNVV